MNMVLRTAVVVLALAATGSGQGPDPYFWLANPFGGWGMGSVDVVRADGSLVTSHNLPTGLIPLGYPAVAKATNGTAWVADLFRGLLIPYTVGGGAGPVIQAPDVIDLAIGANDGPWVLRAAVAGNGTATLYDPTGAVVVSVPLGVGGSYIRPDALGGAWIADNPGGQVQHVDAAGALSSPAAISSWSAVAFTVGRLGRMWQLGVTSLTVYDASAGVVATPLLAGSGHYMTTDPLGRPRVLETVGGTQRITTYDPASFQPIGSFDLVGLGNNGAFSVFRMDAAGRFWMFETSGAITILDHHGDLIGPSPLGSPFTDLGSDPGASTAVAMRGAADADGDGFANAAEVRSGADPLDAASVPPAIQAPVSVFAGQSLALQITSPGQPGFPFATGASAGTAGIPLSAASCQIAPLTDDALLAYWIGPQNGLVSPSTAGTLDAQGAATLSVEVPALASGVTFHVAAATVDPLTGRVVGVTAPHTVSVF